VFDTQWAGLGWAGAYMVVQFGLAMMPLWLATAWPFTSGTTSGVSGSMRKTDELSTTTQPASTAFGAHSCRKKQPVRAGVSGRCRETAAARGAGAGSGGSAWLRPRSAHRGDVATGAEEGDVKVIEASVLDDLERVGLSHKVHGRAFLVRVGEELELRA
jgi:hypothetical protein